MLWVKCGGAGVTTGKFWGKSVGLTQVLITVANTNSNPRHKRFCEHRPMPLCPHHIL